MRFLFDVDGVFTNGFLDYACELLRERGFNAYPGSVSQWDFMEQFNVPRYVEEEMNALLALPGVHDRFQPNELAIGYIRELRKAGHDVFALTAPWSGKTWHSDRDAWLLKHFGIQRSNVIHCSAKYLVDGDVFIDDRATNVGGWESVHPGKLAILWRTPGNRSIAGRHVARSFEDVRNLVTTFYGGK